MQEELEDCLARRRAHRKERITSETAEQREMCLSLLIELVGDDGLHQRMPSSKRYASLDAMLKVPSKLLRSTRPVVPDKEALCKGEEH